MLKYGPALPVCARLRVGCCRGWVLALPRAGHARPAVREKGDQLHIRGSPARTQPQRTLNTGPAPIRTSAM